MGQNSKNNKRGIRKTKMNEMNQFNRTVNPLTINLLLLSYLRPQNRSRAKPLILIHPDQSVI